MEELISGVYKITNPKGRIYIGQAYDLEEREQHYIQVKKNKIGKQIRVYNSILFYGWNAHTFEVWERCPIEELNKIERHWQDFYEVLGPMGMNCKLTKVDDRCGEMCEETKDKMSRSHSGKIISQEQRDMISISKKNKKLSSKHIENMRIAANNRIKDSKREVLQLDMDNNLIKIWENHIEAAKNLDIISSRIKSCLNNKGRSAKGYRWKYKD